MKAGLGYPECLGISEHLERASWRLDLPGRRREDGEGGQGSKEEALVEGHWPGNQDVWVEVLPALLIIVIVIITVKFY